MQFRHRSASNTQRLFVTHIATLAFPVLVAFSFQEPAMHNRTTPQDALVADMVNLLDANLREDFEERAGIIEFEAKKPRAHAECLALIDVLRRHPGAITNVVVLEVEIDGATQWLLTTDLQFARQHMAQIGGIEIDVLDPADAVDEQYDGIALLTTLG
jgi:hypothetical protein